MLFIEPSTCLHHQGTFTSSLMPHISSRTGKHFRLMWITPDLIVEDEGQSGCSGVKWYYGSCTATFLHWCLSKRNCKVLWNDKQILQLCWPSTQERLHIPQPMMRIITGYRIHFWCIYKSGWLQFNNWRGNFSNDDWAKKFISHQIYHGLRMTVHSLIEVTKILLTEGLEYALSEKFCQNLLVAYFRHQRSSRGGQVFTKEKITCEWKNVLWTNIICVHIVYATKLLYS
jgi:hypothetical protein